MHDPGEAEALGVPETSVQAEALDIRDTSLAAETHWARSLSVGSGLLLLSLIAARASSAWIGATYPDRPVPPDFLFEKLPYIPWMGWVTDAAMIASVGLLAVYAFRGNQREIPKMMALIGIMEISRAAINMLTPLASPLAGGEYYGLVQATQNGEFPSGHVASVLLCMLLVDKARRPESERRWLCSSRWNA